MMHGYGSRARRVAWVFTAIALVTVARASAQDPDDRIDPDRPDVTNGTHIVGTGLVQIEVGGLYTSDGSGHAGFGSPLTVRVGLNDWLEARIGTDGLLTQTDADTRVTGFGNVQLGVKLRLWAKPGGVPVLSVLPAVNIPTADAEKGLGTGDADYTVALLTGTDIGQRAHVDFNYGIGRIGAGGGRPHFPEHLLSVSGSYAATSRWNPYGELFWFSRQNIDGAGATAVDAGLIFLLSQRFAIDGGLQAGLSRSAPDLAVFGGLSVVVGTPEGDGVHARRRGEAERHRSNRRSTR